MNFLTIENDYLLVKATDAGAELVSVIYKPTGEELLYEANGSWPYKDHVIFPFIGIPTTYKVGDKEYVSTKHGFVRDSVLLGESVSPTSMAYTLESNEETKKSYPYDFSLRCVYSLEGNALKRSYLIINKGKDPLPFSVGDHAAYKVQFGKATINLGKNDILVRKKTGDIVNKDPEKLPFKGEHLLSKEEFKEYETIIIVNPKRPIVVDTGTGMRIGYHFHSPYIAIWSPSDNNSDFLCVEPWWGMASYEGMSDDLTKRDLENVIGGTGLFEETISFSKDK